MYNSSEEKGTAMNRKLGMGMLSSFVEKKSILLAAVLFGAVTHFWMYSHGLLTPDPLWIGERYIGRWEISSGRWAVYWFDYLHDGLCSPIITAAAVILSYSIAGILITDLFAVKNKLIQYLIPLYMVASPIAAQTLSYHYCADSYSVSLLLATLSTFFIVRSGKWYMLIGAVLALTFSLGIYQGNLGVTAGLCIMVLMLKLLRKEFFSKEAFHLAIRMGLVTIFGTILYYVILQLVLKVSGMEMSSYRGANEIGVISILNNLPMSIKQCYTDFGNYFFSKNSGISVNSYGRYWVHIGLAILFVVQFVIAIANMCWGVMGAEIFLLLILPIGCNMIDLMTPGTGIYLLTSNGMLFVIPFVLSFVEKTTQCVSLQKCTCIMSVVLIYCNILIVNNDSMVMWQTEQQNVQLANRILYSLESYDIYQNQQKVCIAGTPRQGNYPDVSLLSETANPYARWGMIWSTYDGSLACWRQLFHRYLGVDLNWCWEYEYRAIAETAEFKEMPIYPQSGSISYIGDTLVVKVSEVMPLS